MTVITIIGTGRNVGRRLCLRIYRNVGPAVASRAGACSTGMIHRRRREGGKGVVAGVTLGTCWNMRTWHANPGARIVVTSRASVSDRWRCRCVVECSPGPGRRRSMTSVALGGSGNVGYRLLLRVIGKIRLAGPVAG